MSAGARDVVIDLVGSEYWCGHRGDSSPRTISDRCSRQFLLAEDFVDDFVDTGLDRLGVSLYKRKTYRRVESCCRAVKNERSLVRA